MLGMLQPVGDVKPEATPDLQPIDTPSQHQRRRSILRACTVPRLAGALWMLWLIGQIARDRLWLTALCFYIPSPLLALVMVCAALYAVARKQRSAVRILYLLAVFPALATLFLDNSLAPKPTRLWKKQEYRLVHWNVCHGIMGWAKAQQIIGDTHADLVVISEYPGKADIKSLAMSVGSDRQTTVVGDMAIIARGKLEGGHWVERSGGLRIFSVRWELDGISMKLYAVDLASNVLIPRAPWLNLLTELMTQNKPDIVIGDFNAPRRSDALSHLPTGYVHAYEAVGSGWSYTWPMPCPMYAIDQCILGSRVKPIAYSLQMSTASDHLMQTAEVAVQSAK